jgi:hypothetical protein
MSVYIIQDIKGRIKIGKSLHPRLRFSQLKSECQTIKVLAVVEGYTELEDELHIRFKRHKIERKNDWFYPHQDIFDFVATIPYKETQAELDRTELPKIDISQEERKTLLEIAGFCNCFRSYQRGKILDPNLSLLARALANLPPDRWQALKELIAPEPHF